MIIFNFTTVFFLNQKLLKIIFQVLCYLKCISAKMQKNATVLQIGIAVYLVSFAFLKSDKQ